ncbi:hypothetical protein ACP0HM_05185 [Escherichia coli]
MESTTPRKNRVSGFNLARVGVKENHLDFSHQIYRIACFESGVMYSSRTLETVTLIPLLLISFSSVFDEI